MKKVLAFCLALLLCRQAALAQTVPSMWQDGEQHRIERKTFPFYLGGLGTTWEDGEFPLYFVDGAADLPYMELNDFASILNWYFPLKDASLEEYNITVTADPEKNTVTYLRESNSLIVFDFSSE